MKNKISGIYQITNRLTNQFYIGSSPNVIKSQSSNFLKLRNDSHPNSNLQRSFNKYGEEHFSFDVVARVPVSNLFKVEKIFLDDLKPQYNTIQFAHAETRGVGKYGKNTDNI